MIPNISTHDEIVRTLRMLQKAGFGSAVIAGGAIRDLYFKSPPRDIDIFLHDPLYCMEGMENYEKWIGIHHPRKGRKLAAELMQLNTSYHGNSVRRDFYGDGEKISAVWSVNKNQLPFQLIFLKIPPLEFVNHHFDFGICKCYCDGVKFRFTNDFLTDVRNKTITLVGRSMTQDEVDYSMKKHLPRIQEKYPGFTFKSGYWNQTKVVNYQERR